MSSLFARCLQARSAFNRPAVTSLFLTFASATLLLVASASTYGQFAAPPAGTGIQDPSALKPPAGARVAIVEFADMQCPACASANPFLNAAAAKYKIPWVRHDFLIPYHNWSLSAAVNARWLDAQSKTVGSEYRDQVFANQPFIYTPFMLRQFTEKFAQSHGITLPGTIDPQGKLTAEVQADSDLGKRTGINRTPSVFVVTANSKGAPFIEVQHPEQQLDEIIEQALADTAPAKSSRKSAHK
jgi:protein-disulfide isomerase